MAVFYEKGKYFNTDTMEFITYVQKRFLINGNYSTFWCKLYVTREKCPKYFLVRRLDYNTHKHKLIKESEAKALLARYSYDIFLKRFGEQEVPA